ASRSPRATTLMPRSWPSRPTLARTMRMGAGLCILKLASKTMARGPATVDESRVFPPLRGRLRVLIRFRQLLPHPPAEFAQNPHVIGVSALLQEAADLPNRNAREAGTASAPFIVAVQLQHANWNFLAIEAPHFRHS